MQVYKEHHIPANPDYSSNKIMDIIGRDGPAVELDVTIYYFEVHGLENLIVEPIQDVIGVNFPGFQ